MKNKALNEGGPGSGCSTKKKVEICLPRSEYVSVGTRKGMLDNMDYDEYDIPMASIKKVAQDFYIPDKVSNLMQKRDVLAQKPIDVLFVKGDGYHVIDGHHRFLAASKLNFETIPARVRVKSEKTMPAPLEPEEKGDDEPLAPEEEEEAKLDQVEDIHQFIGILKERIDRKQRVDAKLILDIMQKNLNHPACSGAANVSGRRG